MKAPHPSFFLLLLTLLTSAVQSSLAQLDTTGFFLDVGNRWYFQRYTWPPPASDVVIKTIVDTAAGGIRSVRVTLLGTDSTIGTEMWSVVDGSFFVNSVCGYNANLTHDSSYSDLGYGEYTLSIHLDTVTLFTSVAKCQIRTEYSNYFCEKWTDSRTALGIGQYFYGDHGDCGNGYIHTQQLIGFLRHGILYGDTLLTSMGTEHLSLPPSFELHQNYPNPFNPTTVVSFELPAACDVNLAVYDILGRRVAVLVDDRKMPGRYEVRLHASLFGGQASGLASGAYFCRLEARPVENDRFHGFIQTRRMILLK